MSGFEHFARDAIELEREILKRGILLGLDWADAAAMRQLAREALDGGAEHTTALLHDPDPQHKARGELFAFAVLMLRTMTESAETGLHTHGGPAWKAFGRALIEESRRGPLSG
ncbi:hypothetical protein [Aromatoleum anaerobium]|uniref:Uncharacterized protein n=1 Tax=Aromatoleum anaerobium TaxID=182180 RepID=A0ABX1PJC8_9RHOO|nr:hypothetical protein [Aromatoleum anaerobium]MCK0507236.1 hypothetical protein [Aromatoleum anaerobium]